MPNYESNYEVLPLSRKDLREYARYIRSELGLIDVPYFPIVNFLEALQSMGIFYDIVDDAEWIRGFGKEKHAEYNLSDHVIYIRESIYERAVQDCGRDRFTIAHEIAHSLLLDNHSIRVARRCKGAELPLYRNPEWQADCLAGELLVPHHLCKDMSIDEIMEKCKVSRNSAWMQKKH